MTDPKQPPAPAGVKVMAGVNIMVVPKPHTETPAYANFVATAGLPGTDVTLLFLRGHILDEGARARVAETGRLEADVVSAVTLSMSAAVNLFHQLQPLVAHLLPQTAAEPAGQEGK